MKPEDKELTKMKELSKELPGKTVTLSPRNSFFSDADQQYTLCNVPDKEFKEKVKIVDGWKLYSTMLAIRHGLLRVLDESGNDVTAKFGGTGKPADAPVAPVVKEVPKPIDRENERDLALSRLLSGTVEAEVMRAISNRNFPFEDLERLLELETSGENQTSAPRGAVVDGIKELMKNTPGLGRAGKLNDETEATVTARRS